MEIFQVVLLIIDYAYIDELLNHNKFANSVYEIYKDPRKKYAND
jgi:hypothetical protein